MTPTEQNQWTTAATLPELGGLVARWLEGDLASQPGYYGPPDEETVDLTPALARLDRAGYVTCSSQPGRPGQRAAVEGFTDERTAARLLDAAEDADLIAIARPPLTGLDRLRHPIAFARDRSDDGEPVTVCGGSACTWFGRRIPVDQVTYGECSDQMRAILRGSWQVTIIDPEWGRTDLLWHALNSVTAEVT